jgi:NADPH:quinone reductase
MTSAAESTEFTTGGVRPPQVMRAVIHRGAGGLDVLAIEDRPVPVPGDGELLIRVHATAMNRSDVLQRAGRYPAPPGVPADIPGLEYAGQVVAAGAGAPAAMVGRRVMGIVGGGAHAEYLCTPASHAVVVPDALDWVQAAAVPEAFITAHDALRTIAQVQPGEHVLVHAAGSGVGLAAVQLAAALGAVVIGTARTPSKLALARTMGMAHGVVAGGDPQDMVAAIRDLTGGRGVEVTLDLVGGPYLAASVLASALRARIVAIGTLAGGTATLPLGRVLAGRLSIHGTVLRARTPAEKATATAACARDVLPLLERGTVVPVVDTVLPLADIRVAHQRVESNAGAGKVVLLT